MKIPTSAGTCREGCHSCPSASRSRSAERALIEPASARRCASRAGFRWPPAGVDDHQSVPATVNDMKALGRLVDVPETRFAIDVAPTRRPGLAAKLCDMKAHWTRLHSTTEMSAELAALIAPSEEALTGLRRVIK